MALIQRFTSVMQGAMVLTGNTLSISSNQSFPTALDWVNGSYISTNTALVAAAGFPNGTTFNQAQNSSSAILNMVPGSSVAFAQLFWTVQSSGPNANGNINFTLPGGTTQVISPNLALTQTLNSVTWQAQDVKTLINTAGSGTYTVSNVPGPTLVNGSSFSPAAWWLLVVYKNTSLPYRYFNVNTGFAFVQNGAPSDFNFTGFSTPSAGTVKGYLLASETYGDLNDGAQILVGTNLGSAIAVGNASVGTWNGVAPYAQKNNMLPGNILIADTNDSSIGLLDTRGTFGTRNKNPFNTTAPAFARTNTDVFGMDISSSLTNSQTSLFTRINYGGTGSGEVSSQSVQVDVNAANLSPILKSVSQSFAALGDNLTYTISFTNTGLVASNNTVFMDTLPVGVTFTQGTLNINGIPNSATSLNPPGVSLGNISPGAVTTIVFKAVVTSTVPNNKANSSQVTYSFLPAVGLPIQYSDASSNSVTTTIVNATLTKSSSLSLVTCGDTITYTNVYRFTDVPTTISNIIFQDTIPINTTFILNSLAVNGVVQSGVNPTPPGFTVANNISSIATFTITHEVKVNSVTQTTTIPNISSGIYSFNNGSTLENVLINSNVVVTTINPFCAEIYKSTDKIFADVGDIITYTITIPNNGTTLDNVIFKDTLPSSVTIIPNSFSDGGTIISSANPTTGVALSTISPNTVRTITFKVQVNTIPAPNPIMNSATATTTYSFISTNDSIGNLNSNNVSTRVNNGTILSLKQVSKTFVDLLDTLTYTITFTNIGNVTADNITFLDTIPNGTSLVAGSFTVNGLPQGGTPNPPGVSIPNIASGATTTIVFKVLVNAIPTPNPIPNTANGIYTYTVDPSIIDGKSNNTNTNIVYTQVNNADLGNILKYADKSFADCGDVITYTIAMTNLGSVTAQSVILKDTIPNGTVFVANSFTINGVSQSGANPQVGVTLPNIGAGATLTVTFQVQVQC